MDGCDDTLPRHSRANGNLRPSPTTAQPSVMPPLSSLRRRACPVLDTGPQSRKPRPGAGTPPSSHPPPSFPCKRESTPLAYHNPALRHALPRHCGVGRNPGNPGREPCPPLGCHPPPSLRRRPQSRKPRPRTGTPLQCPLPRHCGAEPAPYSIRGRNPGNPGWEEAAHWDAPSPVIAA